mmetsp:Transcript_156734/g.285174  ORF Transcript_156734/g.285174 Transcript_156734/m.285174 type:complete len:253 (-) Transcript_156734:1772-2530(-)
MHFEWIIGVTNPELTVRILCAFLTASRIQVPRVSTSTHTNYFHLRSAPLLKSRRAGTYCSSTTLPESSHIGSVLRYASQILPQPALFRPFVCICRLPRLADPELAICVVPTHFTAHGIELGIVFAIHKFNTNLGSSNMFETSPASIAQVLRSSLLLIPVSSTAVGTCRLDRFGIEFPQITIQETRLALLTYPEITQAIGQTHDCTLTVQFGVVQATNSLSCHQMPSHVLKSCEGAGNIGNATDLVPASTLCP